MEFQEDYKRIKQKFESALERVLPEGLPARLSASMRYSLLGGGKRLRPVLYLSVIEAYGSVPGDADLQAACALECIHTYSLIHDDLPAMDNDDYRRGQPTNHKKFGEATALLAGDGLLNLAYELLFGTALVDCKYLKVAGIIAENAGIRGMVGGQAREFETDLSRADEDKLCEITALKTGKLIEAAVVGGCIAAGKEEYAAVWLEFAEAFGRAFQLCDDLLDSVSGERSLANLLGRERAVAELERLIAKAHDLLSRTGGDPAFLNKLCTAFLLRSTDGL